LYSKPLKINVVAVLDPYRLACDMYRIIDQQDSLLTSEIVDDWHRADQM
jgi:hypothetical protein